MNRKELLKELGCGVLVVRCHDDMELALVDMRDQWWLSGYNWRLDVRHDKSPFATTLVNTKRISLSRLVALRHLGEPPSPDHVCENWDGDLLDCRIRNLKWTKRGETQWHMRRYKEQREAEIAAMVDDC